MRNSFLSVNGRDPMESAHARRRLEWFGFLAGAAVALFCFIRSYAFNLDSIDHLLRMPSDPWGYYQYLPALIGVHPWDQLTWAHNLINGSRLNMFTCGVAIMQLPWFFLGHVLAWAGGYPTNGYSAPYTFSIMLGVSIYAGMAVNFLFHALRRRFRVHVALGVPLLLFAGTNLYYCAARQPSMSHVYVFLLFAVLHYLLVRNIEHPSPWRTAGMIVICSLAILIRQLHAIIVLFPALYLVNNMRDLRERASWLLQRPLIIVGGILVGVLLWVPQMSYWRLVTGKYFVFPYGYKDEHFDFLWRPKLLPVLTDVINGWWLYTPLMALVCLWLARMAWRNVAGGRVLLVIIVLVWYTYAAWWCWWLGGGSLGHRGFVEYYALLAIPLAHGVEHVLRMRWGWRLALALILSAFMWASLRMTADYNWTWSEPGWTWEKLLDEWKSLTGPPR